MSFFGTTEMGDILSRFGQDMSMIEGQVAHGVLATTSSNTSLQGF